MMCNDCGDNIDAAYAALISADVLVEKIRGISEVARIAKAEIRLRRYLEAKWDVRKAEAIRISVSMAKKLKNNKEISSSIGKIMNKWSKDVIPAFNTEIARVYRLARIAGYKKATGQTAASLQFNIPKTEGNTNAVLKAKKPKAKGLPVFDLVDEQAVDSLESKNTFWVGNHYDANISDSIKEITKITMIEAGKSPSESGKLMGDRIKTILGTFTTPLGYTGTQQQYFEGLVANAMTVGRAYGQLRSFSEIGITKYTIVNPGGDRICPVCEQIQGTTFSTKQGLSQIEKEYSAKNPEDIKRIHPWPKLKDIDGKNSTELSSQGLSLPPYHFRCRCTVDVSVDIESYEDLSPMVFPIPPKAA
jgi:hypothetical protein